MKLEKNEAQDLGEKKHIDIETAFSDFVEEFGGEIIDKSLSANPSDNADYLFRNEPVIAELKCLRKNFLGSSDFEDKLFKLYQQWEGAGLIDLDRLNRIRRKEGRLPDECKRDLGDLIKDPIEGIIKKANKQIRESKKFFGLPDAKGLLLLANDGNYLLGHEVMFWLLQRILFAGFCSSIDEIVYFTVNLNVHKPGANSYGPIWRHLERERFGKTSQSFRQKLRDGWIEFFGRIIGQPMVRIDISDDDERHLRFIDHPQHKTIR
jgi:hypothetical protein